MVTTVTLKTRLPPLVAALAVAWLSAVSGPAAADQARKKAHPSPAAGTPAPSRAGDLNSPATNFSDVAPVIEDPRAELLKPRKRKDPNFD